MRAESQVGDETSEDRDPFVRHPGISLKVWRVARKPDTRAQSEPAPVHSTRTYPPGIFSPACWPRGTHARQELPITPQSSVTPARDRKSTRLNSSHLVISYAVFCLKKK